MKKANLQMTLASFSSFRYQLSSFLDSPVGLDGKASDYNAGDLGSIPGLLEKEMAIHSNTLAWKIPWMEESMGSQRVGHD